MKAHPRFIVASALCVPLIAFTVLYLVAVVLPVAVALLPDFIATTRPVLAFEHGVEKFVFVGLCFLAASPSYVLAGLAFACVAVVVGWSQAAKSGIETVLTRIYSVLIVAYVGFALRCLLTKPMFMFQSE